MVPKENHLAETYGAAYKPALSNGGMLSGETAMLRACQVENAHASGHCRRALSWVTLQIFLLGIWFGVSPASLAQTPPDEEPTPRLPRVRAEAPESDLPPPLPVHSPALALPVCEGPAAAPLLAPLPAKGPRPSRDLAAFVESLSTNDATFEVIIGEGRLLTLKENLAAPGGNRPVIAVGDPTVLDYVVIGPRQIRLIGQRIGATDLSITTSEGKTYGFQVLVVADLNVLRAQLHASFPDALLRLSQLRDSIVVEGEARDTTQVARILEMIRSYVLSVQVSQARKISGQSVALPGRPAAARAPGEGVPPPAPVPGAPESPVPPAGFALPEPGQLSIEAKVLEPRVINLIHVPGTQQVLLKVKVAELNRTAMRAIGADWFAVDPESGTIVGTQIGGAGVAAVSTLARNSGLSATATAALGPTNTLFGIFQEGDFEVFLTALRRNLILKILAEPNLVAMNGHQASFLAGGEFPVPVPQVGASGVAPTITVQFKEFGVRLGFVPYILDGDVIRLTVDPEVSSLDFTIGTTLVAGGSVVPGLNSRKAHTTVEMRQGQTLMIAGLLQLSLDGSTQRIPGLGDLPVIGPFFSNTTNSRIEKELVVLVTPYLVEPMNPEQVPPAPGDEVNEPNDLEFYFLGRLEGRTGRDARSTVHYDDPLHLVHHTNLEKKYLTGPCGYSDACSGQK